MALDDRIHWETDTSPATWIAPRLHPFGQDTGSVVPAGFDAYCRIFHPVRSASRWEPSTTTWAEVAALNGRVVHSSMQYHQISTPVGSSPPSHYECAQELEWGECPVAIRTALVNALRRATSTPDHCWFCVWEGYGAIDYPTQLVKVIHPHRSYGLYGGSIDAALVPLDDHFTGISPNLWWPDDHQWIVATEIDFAWTYVGGTRALIQELTESDQIEALPVELSERSVWDSDVINAALNG
jgi:flavin-binding protein dodecin